MISNLLFKHFNYDLSSLTLNVTIMKIERLATSYRNLYATENPSLEKSKTKSPLLAS